MRKRYDREKADRDFKKRVTRNWVICIVSLILIVICYYYV